MIFKLLYTSVNNVLIIAGQNCKLPWMKREANTKLTSAATDLSKVLFSITASVNPTPKPTPSRLCVNW
jgi:hypothetical protein